MQGVPRVPLCDFRRSTGFLCGRIYGKRAENAEKRWIRAFRPDPALFASSWLQPRDSVSQSYQFSREIGCQHTAAHSIDSARQILYPASTTARLITVTKMANTGCGAGLAGHYHYALPIITGCYAVVLEYSCLVEGWGESGGYLVPKVYIFRARRDLKKR